MGGMPVTESVLVAEKQLWIFQGYAFSRKAFYTAEDPSLNCLVILLGIIVIIKGLEFNSDIHIPKQQIV